MKSALVFESFVFVVVVVYSTVAPLKTRLSPGPNYLWLTACLPACVEGWQSWQGCKLPRTAKKYFLAKERGGEWKGRLG